MTVLMQFHGKDRMTAFKALKENLINSPSLGHPNYQIPFVLFVNGKEGHAPGVLIQKHGINTRVKNWTLWLGDTPPPFALEPLWLLPFWLKPQRRCRGIPSNHGCDSYITSFPVFSSHPASFSPLTSCEIRLLTTFHITLSCCNNLHPATFLCS